MAQEQAPTPDSSEATSPLRVVTGDTERIIPISVGVNHRAAGVVAPTVEEQRAANAGEYAPRGFQRWFQNRAKSFVVPAVGTVAAAAAAIAYQNVPEVRRQVDSLGSEAAAWWNSAINRYHDTLQRNGFEVSPTFDNKSNKGMVGENNIARLSQEEIDSLYPDAFKKLSEGENTLQLQYPFDLTTSSDPKANLSYEKSFKGAGAGKEFREKYQGMGIYDWFSFIDVPGGTIIRSPVDGFMIDARAQDETIPPNGSDTNGVLIDFIAPNGNHYSLLIGASTTKDFDDRLPSSKTGFVFKRVAGAPMFTPKKQVPEYGLPIKKGQPILQLIRPTNDRPIEEVSFGLVGASNGKEGAPTNLEFDLTTNNKVAVGK